MTDTAKLLFQKNSPDGLIEVWNNDDQRWLTIDSIEQTRIDIRNAEQLVLPVHRAFLAALLFIETPDKVLLGGLGGGALARYLHNRNSEIHGDAIEIDATIAGLARDYFYFPEQGWNIFIEDFRQWKGAGYDLMIVDIADSDLTPSWLISEEMLSQLKQQLNDRGMIAIDLLVDDAASFGRQLKVIREVFKRQTLCISVPEHKNIIVFAFDQPPSFSMTELKQRAERLTAVWGVNFSDLLEQLKKDNPKQNGIF